MRNEKFDAIILAAGVGRRFISSIPKQYIEIHSKSLIDIAIEKITDTKKINNIVVVINKHNSYRLPSKFSSIFLVNGGNTRTKSVYNGLKFIMKCNNHEKNVIIHDAARPCIEKKDIMKLLDQCNSLKTGLSLGYPLTNALKMTNKNLIVKDNIKRDNLYMSFTPQVYNYSKLFDAYSDIIKKKIQVDDEIEAMSLRNHKVKIIKSSVGNIKLTYKDDLETITALMKKI